MKTNIVPVRKAKPEFITKKTFAFICLASLCVQTLPAQVKQTGSLWGMGNNTDGQLAGNFTGNTNKPVEMITSNVTAVAAGYYHSLWLESDGSLWGVGEQNQGQLGNGTYGGGAGSTIVPVEIVSNGVVAISAGSDFSLFLKNDGSLWGMGDEQSGQLGNGTYGSYPNYSTNVPVEITNGVTAIAAGFAHSLFIGSNGSLWAMGDNTYGELGNGTQNPANVPIEILDSNVTAIAAGQFYSLFVKTDGSLWGMGYNPVGNLGDGNNHTTYVPVEIQASGVTTVSAGGIFSLFIRNNGSLWGMGNNDNGQLGDGTINDTNLPVQITSGVTAIVAGDYDSLFIMSDGSLWDMGNDQSGQLGDDTYGGDLGYVDLPVEIETNGVIAISTGYDHSLFVMGPPLGYNQTFIHLASNGSVSLSYVGMTGTNYELDRSFSLSPAVWVPQLTNAAGEGGALVFTVTPNPTGNNFWRIHSVP